MIPCAANQIIERSVKIPRTLRAHVLLRQRRRPFRSGGSDGSSCCSIRTFSHDAGTGRTTPVLSHHRSQRQDDAALERPHFDAAKATELVDSMLRSTRQLVRSASQRERNFLHVVAFSGGVDSTLATALLQRAVGPTESWEHGGTDLRPSIAPSSDGANDSDGGDRVLAVLGVSAAVSREQLDQARRVADELRVEFRTVETREGSDPTYLANIGQACRACKTHLYSTLESIHRSAVVLRPPLPSSAAEEPSAVQLYNGTNADDLLDATRVGLMAAQQYRVLSPLQFYTKHQVRTAARHLGLSNWNAAAAPCLRSRLSLGVPATRKHLQTIERAERHVRATLQHSLSEASNVRVRMLAHNQARIELDETHVEEAMRVDWRPEFIAMGFDGVSVRPFRSGSVATPQFPKPLKPDGRDLEALVS